MSNCKQFHGKPIKCNAYKGSEETGDEGTVYQYTAATVKGKIGQCRKLRRGADHEKAKESARRRDKLEKLFQEDAALMVQKKYKAKKFKRVKSQFLDLSRDLAKQKKLEEEAEIEVRS